MRDFKNRILEEKPLLNDGAMGTQLQAAGLVPGECGDHWNLLHPDKVTKIHQAYIRAGSESITTNTFGASRIALQRHNLANEVKAINRTAVQIARRSFDGNGGFVLGDIGPFGGMLEPYGDFKSEDVLNSFRDQADALVSAGVDAVIIETMTALEELGLAIQAAREAGAAIVIATMSFDRSHDGKDARTMMGISPEQAAEFMQKSGVDIAGTNCGTGIDAVWASKIIKRFQSACDLPLIGQPNCGQPEWEGSKIVYREKPLEMAANMRLLIDAGASIVGACCGSTPEHIGEIRKVLDL
jgi:5-methyltetrahydrofolate--homocysteine methyltransferase